MMCSGRSSGQRGECLRPVLQGMQIQLCPMHLLLAVEEVKELGGTTALKRVIAVQRAREKSSSAGGE